MAVSSLSLGCREKIVFIAAPLKEICKVVLVGSFSSNRFVVTAAGLSVPTVKRAEADEGFRVSEDAMLAIANALKKAGVEFIDQNGGGPGVRLRKAKR